MTDISRKNVPFKKTNKAWHIFDLLFPNIRCPITDLSPFHLQPDKNCDPV